MCVHVCVLEKEESCGGGRIKAGKLVKEKENETLAEICHRDLHTAVLFFE